MPSGCYGYLHAPAYLSCHMSLVYRRIRSSTEVVFQGDIEVYGDTSTIFSRDVLGHAIALRTRSNQITYL